MSIFFTSFCLDFVRWKSENPNEPGETQQKKKIDGLGSIQLQ